ncbi:MAG TPA: DUF2723 domain-containing protein [Candidatus Methylomirabilis sp.]|nr:DUF2723 domain-containing protein [Gemmatimonadaceae bacterium]HYB41197.1 DUF2723 domain-containing protein [Candidatus Methylomirabilis sp.]
MTPGAIGRRDGARAAVVGGSVLALVYIATLAPGLTFWDSGEFIAAVQTFGIPHPSGTPLLLVLARAWRECLWWLPTAAATNMLSAACTAAAGAIVAWIVARHLRGWIAGAAAAVGAGTMSTVWLNATETEVYGASLLLAMAAIAAADLAGLEGEADGSWRALACYCLTLAIPLHLSALVCAPSVIVLAGRGESGEWRWRSAVATGGIAIAALGTALARVPVMLAGAALVGTAAARAPAAERRSLGRAAVVALIALSALAILPLRARHDPPLNAGNAVTWRALVDVVARRQYGAQPLWPRQAPWWIQLGNLFEYADWQVALGLAPGVAPSWRRTPVTILFGAVALVGALTLRRRERRLWEASAVLLASATIGVVIYLNLKAGASYGWGVLPDNAPHEARDRAYFFALAFWIWGAWAGIGVVELARRVAPARRPVVTALILAPMLLNWRAVDRRREPEAHLPLRWARALLFDVPPRAVLFTGGDNDTFPIWYAQYVEHIRPDVTIVVSPLLPASWYRAALSRRESLLSPVDTSDERMEEMVELEVVRRARAAGRPVGATIEAEPVWYALGSDLTLRGLLVWADPGAATRVPVGGEMVMVDTAAAARFSAAFPPGPEPAAESIDPAPGRAARLLSCPEAALKEVRWARVDSLDSRCKAR